MLSITTTSPTMSLLKSGGEAAVDKCADVPKVLLLPRGRYLKHIRERSRRATVWFARRVALVLVVAVIAIVLGQLLRSKANSLPEKAYELSAESENVTALVDGGKHEVSVLSGVTRLRVLTLLLLDTFGRSGLGVYYLLAVLVFAIARYDDRFCFVYCPKVSIRQPAVVFDREQTWNEIKISLLYLVPFRLISRVWGWLNTVRLPVALRAPLYRWYATTFGCNLAEMSEPDLSTYENLGQFFLRTLRPEVRPIAGSCLVSPSDGRLVQQEAVCARTGRVGNVKGINYAVDNFLGRPIHSNGFYSAPATGSSITLKAHHRLYSVVIYLAPGDYHRFHSPTNWTVQRRRHFSGRLFSVRPAFVASFADLFAINERVVYEGQWTHGYFSMTAVGATNVGSVAVNFDRQLKTNQAMLGKRYQSSVEFGPHGRQLKKGEMMGEFRLGSTIVLLFEAPEHAKFNTSLDQKVRFGQSLAKDF